MNKTHDGKNYGMTQYRWALDYELAGRSFTLRSENAVYQLGFQDREFIECGGVLSQYEALKLDSDLHVVFFGETITAAVLDLASGTAVISTDEKGQYDFCRVDGFDADVPLPAYTDEMSGTEVRWYFGCGRFMEHSYLTDGMCRCVWSPRTDRPRNLPATYIKLSEGKYLVELNRCSPLHSDMPQGFSRIILVQDWMHLLTVGSIYNPRINEFRLVSGYAMPPGTE